MDDQLPIIASETGFARERRRRMLSRIAARLRSEPDDVSAMLPFEEVLAALGRRGETDLGVQTIAFDTIVGTADRRSSTFDRAFRPVSEECAGAGSASRRRGAKGSSFRRSTSTGSASCTSSRMVITGCRSHARWATRRSRLTCGWYRRAWGNP